MEICKDMLDELEAHKMAWPFLVAVNAKQVIMVIFYHFSSQILWSKRRKAFLFSRDDILYFSRNNTSKSI